jgi:hypothetical protein
VPPAFLRVVEDRGQAPVQLPPPRRGQLRQGDRREQRVREPHLLGVELHDAGGGRRLDRLAASREPVDQRHRGPRQRRDRLHRLQGGWGEQGEAVVEQPLEAGGDRQLLGRRVLGAVPEDGEGDLLGEEGVAAGHAVEPQQRPPRQRRGQPGGQQPVQLRHGERSDLQAVQAAGREGAVEVQRDPGLALEPPGDQQADPLVGEPAGYEGERAAGGLVQPLDVVDGDQRGAAPRERAEHAQQPERDRPGQGLPLLRLRAQQGHLQRVPLRPWQLAEDRVGNLDQQVAKGGVGELRLGVDRPARQHAVRAARGGLQAVPPEGGLPDADLALDHERDRTGRDRVEEPLDAAQLRFTADDRPRPCGHRRGACRHG